MITREGSHDHKREDHKESQEDHMITRGSQGVTRGSQERGHMITRESHDHKRGVTLHHKHDGYVTELVMTALSEICTTRDMLKGIATANLVRTAIKVQHNVLAKMHS